MKTTKKQQKNGKDIVQRTSTKKTCNGRDIKLINSVKL